jgi:cell division protein FtsI/penicillin-binding protein 2
MEAMKAASIALACLLTMEAPMMPRARMEGARADLYGEAARVMLDRSFPSPRLEYLLFDIRSKRVEAMRWAKADEPIPAGSLLKPFVAIAYADLQRSGKPVFPVVTCHGAVDGCWRARGHGPMTLERALAESCNAYFLTLARAVAGSDDEMRTMERIRTRFGLPLPVPSARASIAAPDLIGLTTAWRVTPSALASAYAVLLAEPATAVTSRLYDGMRMAAEAHGTAWRVGQHAGGVLAKTGTAPCIVSAQERCAVNGDGLVIVAFPAHEPSQLLLVRERATTGAEAAATAGTMLTVLEKSDAAAR